MPAYFSWFLSPLGLLVLAAFDSSVAFFLPLANDTLVVYLAASDSKRFWLYPIMATAGAVIGCASTYWVGSWIGEEGLVRWVPPRRLESIQDKVRETGAIAMALPALIPPPFPFTPFMLASGALEVDPWTFLSWVGICRFARFMAEAVLARIYGERLLGWMNSETFQVVVWGFIVLALAGSAWSIYALIRKTRAEGRGRRTPRPA